MFDGIEHSSDGDGVAKHVLCAFLAEKRELWKIYGVITTAWRGTVGKVQ